jgi:hypothetical protein
MKVVGMSATKFGFVQGNLKRLVAGLSIPQAYLLAYAGKCLAG